MSFGQSILTILALIVITYLVLSANRVVTQSLQDELKGEAFNQAGEIANDIISEAMSKSFDDPSGVYNSGLYLYYRKPSDFTPPSKLGPERTGVPTPDIYPYKSITWDDFDDYDGYQRIVDTPIMKGFVVNCTVTYVDTINLITPVNIQTYCKRLVVKVTQPTYLPDTLFFSTIMTY